MELWALKDMFAPLCKINEVATVLPQLPSNVKAIKMVRTFIGSDGQETNKTFMVN